MHAERLIVRTHDGADLDTFEINCRATPNTDITDAPYIVFFNGNGTLYEQTLRAALDTAQDLECNIVSFNYRGVNRSTGHPQSPQDLVTDGIAQVQRLIDMRVPAEAITLHGRSLGGAIASLTAKHFHDRGYHINIFNERSFSSLTNVVVGLIRRTGNSGYRESTAGKILGWIAYPFIRFGIGLVDWEINAGDAYQSIPEEYRQHAVARSSRADRETIPPLRDTETILLASITPEVTITAEYLQRLLAANGNYPILIKQGNEFGLYGYYQNAQRYIDLPNAPMLQDLEFPAPINEGSADQTVGTLTTDAIPLEMRSLFAQAHARPDDGLITHYASIHHQYLREKPCPLGQGGIAPLSRLSC